MKIVTQEEGSEKGQKVSRIIWMAPYFDIKINLYFESDSCEANEDWNETETCTVKTSVKNIRK